MSRSLTEDLLAEQPTLEWLRGSGWSYLHGSVLAPDGPSPERAYWSDVVLVGRLERAVRSLNPDLPADAVQRVVELVLTTTSPVVIDDHAALHDFLIQGVPITWADADGTERSARARLIDFANLLANDLLAVNQFTMIFGDKNRRPDVLLFVNGLPLGQIELKNPGKAEATAEKAINQIADYKDAIPGLYRFVEIIGVSDLLTAGAGTITTPAEHFAEWKSMDPAEDEGRSALEVMVKGLFAPAQFLDMVQNFMAFETDGARTWKTMAKYHQVDAVNRAVDATREAMGHGGRAGVVWHTQGSGKSLTMVFYAHKIRRDPAFANPTIVAVTDRNDLDQQLYETFMRQRDLTPTTKQADSVDGGTGSLRDLLTVPAGGIVFTTIQKFQPGKDEDEMPEVSGRSNIVVMADEAHRSQYASFAENLMLALPNATRIGFTGTPVERRDKNTRLTFGEYISIYPVQRAVEDGATVPIFYESRRVPIELTDEELLAAVDDALSAEEEEAQKKVNTRWAKLERVVGNEKRVEAIAADITVHFTERCETLEGKGLVVSMSREIAARLTGLLKKALGNEVVTCVMSVSAEDTPEVHGPGGEYRRSKDELRKVAENFKDPDHPLRLVVVRDMWLTGFDVPSLHTMYIDKPMKDHGLLQAIARVNRVFRDKPGGLVVDYIGIGEDLRASLAAYDPGIADDAMIPLETAVMRLREKHEVLTAKLHPLPFQDREKLSPGEQATLFVTAVNQIVADDADVKSFLEEQGLFARWFSLVRPHPPTHEIGPDAAFFAAVAGALRKVGPSSGDPSPEAEQAVKQFFSEGLAAGEIVDVFELAGEERPEISILSDDFLEKVAGTKNENLGVAVLRRLLDNEIRVRTKKNALQAALFSDRIDSVLARYHNRQLTSAEVIKALIEIAKAMRAARRRNEELGLSEEEVAFYDALAGGTKDIAAADPVIAAIAHDLVKGIRGDLSVDWTSRKDTQAKLRTKIKRLLTKHGYKPPTSSTGGGGGGGGGGLSLDEVCSLVLQQARVLYAAWPEV